MLRPVVLLLMLASSVPSGVCGGTEVYWAPAHALVPQDPHGLELTSGDLDADQDVDISFTSCTPVLHYWNIGSPWSPIWLLDTGVYDGINDCYGRVGALGDLDSDGDLDLVTTCYDGSLHLVGNVGTPVEPSWQESLGAFGDVDVLAGGSEPSLADIDGDGDLDLLVAVSAGVLVAGRERGQPRVVGVGHRGPCPRNWLRVLLPSRGGCRGHRW